VRFLCSANHGFLYHVHHIVGVYITLYVDTLAVGHTTKALRSELRAIGLRPHDTGWVGGSIEVLLGVMYPAGPGVSAFK
jgi:hypothetical protein